VSANPWAWAVFPSSNVFFKFFSQGFMLFITEVFQLIG
jgi:hypothetical protein